VVARTPRSSPAAPQISAPVQIEKTHVASAHAHRQRDGRRGARLPRGAGRGLQGHPVCRAAGGRAAMARAAARQALARRTRCHAILGGLRAESHRHGRLPRTAGAPLWRELPDAPLGAFRRLPVPERLDARMAGERAVGGDVLDAWRIQPDRQRQRAGLRWRGTRQTRRGGGDDQLPARSAGLLCPPRTDPRIAAPVFRQLRIARSDRRAAVGARQHRAVWRRPRARDGLRRVRRLHRCGHADVFAAGRRTLRARHHGERPGARPRVRAQSSASGAVRRARCQSLAGASSIERLRALPAQAILSRRGRCRQTGAKSRICAGWLGPPRTRRRCSPPGPSSRPV
jgi:hypothetical protein